jgi:hypothetical protein
MTAKPDDVKRTMLLAWRRALLMQVAAIEKRLGMRPAQAEPADAKRRKPPEVPKDAIHDQDR